MPPPDFRPRITYTRPLSQPLENYITQLLVPTEGARHIPPVFIPWVDLQMRILRNNPAGGIQWAVGLTDAEFSVGFSDFNLQWRRLIPRAAPPVWQFQRGGVVYLDLAITVYVDDRFRQRPDIVERIMRHELLHVRDEINIVRDYLMPLVPSDDDFRRHFIQQNLVDEIIFERWYRNREFRGRLYVIWLLEHNQRARVRDGSRETAEAIQRLEEYLRTHPL